MKGILFGSYHSYYDLHLILTKKEIGSPAVKVKKIEVEGADSDLDLSDFFGEPKYENVKHKFDFSTLEGNSLSLFSNIKNALHGKKVRIILDDDPTFFYVGRLHVSSWTNEKGIAQVTIEADCEPYKYKLKETVASATLDGTTANMYDTSKITLVSSAIKLGKDDFFEIDATNNGTAWQYITFFHNPFAAGEIAPSQNVTIVLETKDFFVSGTADTRMFFTSGNEVQLDYFSPSSFSTSLVTHDRKIWSLYPVPIKDADAIANAVFFIRSFIALPPGSSCKGRFRISILPGDVSPQNFQYISHDGTMRGLQIANSRKRAVPRIMASNAVMLYHEGNIYAVSAGSAVIPELELKEGINDIAVKGSGTITFTWQEGDL